MVLVPTGGCHRPAGICQFGGHGNVRRKPRRNTLIRADFSGDCHPPNLWPSPGPQMAASGCLVSRRRSVLAFVSVYGYTSGAVELRVREWREQRGFSYRALAKRAGIGLSTLYRIESGEASPTVAMLERLAGALDIRVVDFFPCEPESSRRAKG